MDLNLLENEVSDDGLDPGGEAEPVAGGDEVGAGELADEARAGSTGQEAAPAWSSEDPAFQEAVRTVAAEQAQQLFYELLSQAGGEEVAIDDDDPYADPISGETDPRFKALEERLLGPIRRLEKRLEAGRRAEAEAAGNQEIETMIAHDVSRNGDFLSQRSKAQVIRIANQEWAQVESRYPEGTPMQEAIRANAAVTTMQKAISDVRAYENEVRDAARNGLKTEIETVADALPQTGGSSALGLQEGAKPTSLLEYGQRFAARRA